MGLFAYFYEISAHLIVTDEDSADFLQSQFSNDLRPFEAGQCTYGLWLDVKGKIVADSWVLCEGEEAFRVFSEHGDISLIKEKLENHIIADDVQLELGSKLYGLALMGEGVEGSAALKAADFSFPGRRSGRPCYELIFSDEGARQVCLEAADYEVVSKEWIQLEQMKSGLAQVYAEILPGDLPGEGGLVGDAVSLTKGCFLGQEVVARMHNVGRPQRGLYFLAGSGTMPEVPAQVTNPEGKRLGDLRTCIGEAAGWQGIAILKTRFVEEGMQLLVSDQSAAVKGAYSKAGD